MQIKANLQKKLLVVCGADAWEGGDSYWLKRFVVTGRCQRNGTLMPQVVQMTPG